MKCTRCNAVQNIHTGQTQFECWQCKTVIPAPLPFGAQPAAPPLPPKPKAVAAKAASARPKSAASNEPKPPPPGVLAVGAAVKVIAVDDEHKGQIGTVQTFFDDADDGLDVGVIFKGDTGIYAFGRTELSVVTKSASRP